MKIIYILSIISYFHLTTKLAYSQKTKQVSNFRIDQDNCQSLQTTLERLIAERKDRTEKTENLEIIKQCYQRARKLNCDYSLGYCHEYIGSIYFDNGLIERAVDEYAKGIPFYTKLKRNEDLARLQNKLGVAYTFQGSYEKGLDAHLTALNILEKINLRKSELMADVYTNLATVYEEENRGNEVLRYLGMALKIYQTKNNAIAIADVYNNYGKYYFNKEKNIQKAKHYYEKAFEIKNRYPESISLAVTAFNLGIIYLENLNDLKMAAFYFEKTKTISKSFENVYYEGMALQGIGEVYRKNNRFQKSEELLLEAAKLQKSVNSLPEIVMCYESLYQLYKDQGKYDKALDYKLKQIDARDSIYNQNKSKEFFLLEQKFKSLEGSRKLEILKRNKEIRELKIKKQQTIIISIISVFLLTLGVIWYYFRTKISNRILELEMKNAKVSIRALNSQLNSHFIANTLVSIKNFMNIKNLEKSNDVINKFSKLLRNILINSQESLIPLREDIEILKVYLALEEINHSNSFSWTLELDESLLTNSFYTPPMLIQPIVENAIKYGVYENDGLISIRYFRKGDNIEIEVRDNGKPISTIKDNQLINEGTGTKLIKERLDLFNQNNKSKSTINFHNLSPKGNLVKITIPIQK
jgi:tetratricopeptide (TPR) repeat protein